MNRLLLLLCSPRTYVYPRNVRYAGVTTAMLLATVVPEDSFQLPNLGNGEAHNWCIRPQLENSLLLRFTDGCKILLASMIGMFVILLVALIINNLHPKIGYPKRWL